MVRRGRVYFAKLGNVYGAGIQDGIRPVLVISRDLNNFYSDTVNVIPITSKIKRMDLPCHVIVRGVINPEYHGVKFVADEQLVLCEQITTIPKSILNKHHFLTLTQDEMRAVESGIRSQLFISY